MIHRWQFALISYIIGVALSSSLFTTPFVQVESGSISGVVKDSAANGAVASALVTAVQQSESAPSGNKRFETVTDSEGRYHFNNLPPGIYEIRADVPRFIFEPVVRENVSVQRSQDTKVDLQLKFIEACEGSSETDANDVNDSDKAEIVKLVLEDALVKKNIPDYNMLTEQRGNIIVSVENIKPSWIPELPGFKLTLLSPAEIQRKADRGRDFLYLSFVKFEVRGSCVAVTIANTWAVGEKSGMGYLSGGGVTYAYRRQSDKWIGKIISAWIS